jgi:S-DNA-T family DNA segregation ATPase FtsK/SpoIIIE
MRPQLIVISGPDQGRTISLAEGQTLTIGRGEAVAARLADPHVSRTHCQIEVDGGRFRLSDCGSPGRRRRGTPAPAERDWPVAVRRKSV